MYALLVADDPDESAFLMLALKRAGLVVTVSSDLDRAMNNWSERPADLIVIALRSLEPLKQAHRVRSETEVALVIITPPIIEDEHYALLESGADMVIQRPYSSRLLVAQLRALLRRAGGVPIFSLPALDLHGLTLDPVTRTVQVVGHPPKRLTHLEFRLLYTLMIHRGQVLPTDTIVERVWGYNGQGSRDLVRGLISRLRAKVEIDNRRPQYVITVPGVGYAFRNEDSE